MTRKIYLLCGPVRTGKTTRIMDWSSSSENVDGITAPVYLNQKHMFNLKTGVMKNLENVSECAEDKIITVGTYKFNPEVFEWGRKKLKQAASTVDLKWLVIDEIGLLELDGRGLEPEVTRILNNRNNYKFNILLIVRESLVDDVMKKYNFTSDDIEDFTNHLI